MRTKFQIFYWCKPRLPSQRSGAVRGAAQRQVGVSLPAAPIHPYPGNYHCNSTHSRLYHRALTGGGSVSGLLPTLRRRPRRRAPPGPAALSPGFDLWWLRHRAHTGRHPLACPNGTDASGQSHHPSCMSVDSVRHQRSWAKSPPCCMSVRHRHPWAMSTLKYRTVPRKIDLMFHI